jgi:hypothetical protein
LTEEAPAGGIQAQQLTEEIPVQPPAGLASEPQLAELTAEAPLTEDIPVRQPDGTPDETLPETGDPEIR